VELALVVHVEAVSKLHRGLRLAALPKLVETKQSTNTKQTIKVLLILTPPSSLLSLSCSLIPATSREVSVALYNTKAITIKVVITLFILFSSRKINNIDFKMLRTMLREITEVYLFRLGVQNKSSLSFFSSLSSSFFFVLVSP